jgi:crotonobetainyl-CoA:carnitine CoA-transferase CaiB-like acyl-CoA transferase
MWGAVFDQPELGLGYPRMLTPHRRPYATRDGYISVIAVSDAHWGRLFAAMDRASLIDDPRFATIAARSDNVDALYAVLTEGMRERTSASGLPAARARRSLWAGQYACRADDGRIPARDRIFQRARHPLTATSRSPPSWRSSPPRRRLHGLLSANIPPRCCAIGCDEREIQAIDGS